MTRVRIENATYLVTVNDTDDVLADATLLVDHGVITEITQSTAHHGEPRSDAADEVVVDARG